MNTSSLNLNIALLTINMLLVLSCLLPPKDSTTAVLSISILSLSFMQLFELLRKKSKLVDEMKRGEDE